MPTNIYKVPCYIEFTVEGELVPGSLTKMTSALLESLYITKRTLSVVGEEFDIVQSDNENKSFSIKIKQYELPKEFIKAVISLL